MSATERYLGDGAYASFDGHRVMLRVPSADGDHLVALEAAAMTAFLSYLWALVEKYPELLKRWHLQSMPDVESE